MLIRGSPRLLRGDIIVEAPGAAETYADFVNASGRMVGSYVDAEGIYHAYVRGSGWQVYIFGPPERSKIRVLFSARYQRCRNYRWPNQTGGGCPAHLCRYTPARARASCSSRVVLARRVGISIRTAFYRRTL